MGKHWVRARKIVDRKDMAGISRIYHPGDWFEVRNQEMRRLLEAGVIQTTPQVLRAEYKVDNAGLLLRDGAVKPHNVAAYGLKCQEADGLTLPWERTVILGAGAALQASSIIIGLSRIEAGRGVGWEMAVLLDDHRKLARDVGTEEEKAKTIDVVGDLRLPVYDTSVLWVRRTEATEDWLAAFRDELVDGADEAHAFLRTLYTRRLMLCTLPAGWIGRWHGA